VTLPCQPVTVIRLGVGASFGDPLILGDQLDGILGTNILASSTIQEIDISSQVTRISTRHGRDRMFEQYLPGEATIEFLDFNGDWNPANTSSPYYPEIKPMRQVKMHTTYNGTEYALFAGFITSWDYTWPDASADYAIVTIQATDGFRLMQLANIDTVAGAANKDLPGTRIDLILDAISWPSGQRSTLATPSSRTTPAVSDQPSAQSKPSNNQTLARSLSTTTAKRSTTVAPPSPRKRPAHPTNSTTPARTSNTKTSTSTTTKPN
jgi:hypothetical protein